MGLLLAKSAVFCAELAADVRPFIDIHVCDSELSDAKAGQGQKMDAANSAGAGYSHSCLAEFPLIGFADQADVARKLVADQVFNDWCWHAK